MAIYNSEKFRSNPNTDFLGSVPEEEIIRAEETLGVTFHPLIRQYIHDFGSVQIQPDDESEPKLLLLGLGEHSTIDDNIILFNEPENPSNPSKYLVFAHEFDGISDIVYAIALDNSVMSLKSWFAFPYYEDKTPYASAVWNKAFESIEDFWSTKIEKYLNW